MPLKRTYSTSTEIVPAMSGSKYRRVQGKRAKRYPANGTVGKPTPFPIRMVVRFKYSQTFTISSALVSTGNYNFACNSIYDPDLTGTGHQPYAHDTYSTIYNQYTVLKSFIKVTPVKQQNEYLTIGLGIEDSVLATTNFDTWSEKPTYKLQGCMKNGSTYGNPITMSWDRAKRFPKADTYRDLSAPFGANPAEIEVFNFCAQAQTSADTVGGNIFLAEIWYTCELYELASLGSS